MTYRADQTPPGAAPLEATRNVLGFRLLPFDAPRLRRGVLLLVGLYLFGVGLALTIEADLGADPWTVFHQGVADRVGASIGTITIATGLAIISLLWLLREPLGVGTIGNAIVVGVAIDVTLWMIPDLSNLALRIALLAAAPLTIGVASGFYLGSKCGPGPRDGLMTALSRRGVPTWLGRTGVEMSALLVGFLLGGTVGLGTVWMALTIGPCVQFFLKRIPPLPTGAGQ